MRNSIAASLLFVSSSGSFAQSAFEAASIRQNKAEDRIVRINIGPGGRFTVRGYTVGLLIQQAYGVMGWNIAGGPAWIHSDHWDIVATAEVPGGLDEARLRPLLQNLLAERFKLRLREGSMEMAGYALVVAKGGPKMKASTAKEDQSNSFRLNFAGLEGQGISMPNFARYVAGKIGVAGVDQTGLRGLYDVYAQWKIEDGPDAREELKQMVFGALQDQLGLRLAPQKITVEQLIVDSVERASGN